MYVGIASQLDSLYNLGMHDSNPICDRPIPPVESSPLSPAYQLREQRIIHNPKELPWPLSPEEQAYFASNDLGGRLPFAVSSHYLSLVQGGEDDPVRRQIVPRVEELQHIGYELEDPLGEDHYSHNSQHGRQQANREESQNGGSTIAHGALLSVALVSAGGR